MDMQLTNGWTAVFDRGPDWLYVRLIWEPASGEMQPQLVDPIFQLLKQQLLNRLVLELDQVPALEGHLVGELKTLDRVISSQGGMLRLAGVSDENQRVLQDAGLGNRFPQFRDRQEAVSGYRPRNPR